MSAASLLLCDDTADIRQFLRAHVSAQPDLTVIGEAVNGREAIEKAAALQPDIVILDLAMPVMDGLEALPRILEVAPRTKVIVLSGLDRVESESKALGIGASVYITKGASLQEIIEAVRRVCGLELAIAESPLSRSQEKRLFTLSLDLLCIARADGYFEHLSPSWERLLGWTVPELKARPYIEFVHPEDRPTTVAEQALLDQGHETMSFENRYVCKDGSYRWLSWRATMPDADGATYGSARDITDEKRAASLAKDAISASEALKSGILEAALDCVVGMDAAGKIVEFNPAAERIFGYERHAVLGRDLADLLLPTRYRDAHRAGLKRAAAGGSKILGRRIEIEALHADGSEFPVELAITRVDLSSGPVYTGVIRDISPRRQMERDLKESEERFRSLVQNSRDAIAVIDINGVCTYASPSVTNIGGFAPEDIVGKSGFEFIHEQDRESVAHHLAEIIAVPNSTKTLEVRSRTTSGGWIWIEIRAVSRLDDPVLPGIILNFHDVTERRIAVERIAHSERLLAEAQAISRVGSFAWDFDTGSGVWSDEQFRLFGYEPGSVKVGEELFLQSVHPDDRGRVLSVVRRCRDEGTGFDAEYRIVRGDGSIRWMHGRGEVAFVGGRPGRVVGTSEDVTDRRQAEAERTDLLTQQQELAERLRLLLESTGDGIYGVDQDGCCTFINKAAAAMLGFAPDELLGRSMHALIHHSKADGPIYGVFETEEPAAEVGEVFWRKDGTSFPVEYSSHATLKDGEPVGAVVAFRDVSARLKMEDDLRASEQLFRGAFRAARTGIALIDADGRRYVDVNEALCEMLGYSKDELLRLDWLAVTYPDDRERNLRETADFFAGREETNVIHKRYVRKDGVVISVEISDALVRGPDGNPLYFVTHVTDVTERAHAARALRESKELLQAVIDNSPAVIYIKERDGRYALVNDRYLKIFNLERGDALGRTDLDIFPAPIAERIMVNDRLVFDKKVPIEVEETVPHNGGDTHTYLSVKFPLLDETGECYAVCGISTDITERVKAEEEKARLEGQLRQAQKMEAVGQLAGGVAHDFNNILAVILNYAEFVTDDTPSEDPRLEDVQQITQAAQKGASLVRQLLSFSRKEVLEHRVLNLNDVVDGVRGLLERSISEDIALEVTSDPDLWCTRADSGQVEQILLNLTVNARDAMPTGGTISVATSNETVEGSDGVGVAPGSYVCLKVTDTGSGMDPATAERIFEPFFTTKPRGKGTGLGLATVYAIAQQAGGGLHVDSALGHGTSFSIYLPATDESVDKPFGNSVEVSRMAGCETVLVVEDEDSVRRVVSRILSKHGFEVIAMRSGAHAADFCKRHDGRIDLLLTDVVMPVISGKDLVELVRSTNEDIKVLYMSGYTDEIVAERGVLETGQYLLKKPFTASQLVSKVRAALGPADLADAS